MFDYFKKKPPPPPTGQVTMSLLKYKNSSIWIQGNAGFANYPLVVAQYLDDINLKLPNFLPALVTAGRVQKIYYHPGNSCRGNPRGYVKLREAHKDVELGGWGNRPAFAAELQATMNRANMSVAQLAQRLLTSMLYNWQGGTDPNPFSSGGFTGTVVKDTEDKIRTWLAATDHPKNDEMDVLIIELKDFVAKNNGADTQIYFDPTYNALIRPPQVGLFHELVHAYYFAKGTNLGIEDSNSDKDGGRYFELMAMGLPPFDNKRFSENKIRLLYGCALRASY